MTAVYDREFPNCGAPLRIGEKCFYCDYQDPGNTEEEEDAQAEAGESDDPPAPEPDLGGEGG